MTINDIDKAYEKALLAKLAYEDLDNWGRDYLENYKNKDKVKPFTTQDAEYLSKNFELIDIVKTGDFESDFQGCLVRNKNTNEVTFAIRGTQGFKDQIQDADIGLKGMVVEQFVDAYNWFIEKTTPNGVTAKKIVYNKPIPDGTAFVSATDLFGTDTFFFEDFVGTEKKYSNISLVGHSLGGHLAGLIGMITNLDTTIFNAPSFKTSNTDNHKVILSGDGNGNTESVSSYFIGIIGKLFGVNYNNQSNISHIYNENYSEIIADLGGNWKKDITSALRYLNDDISPNTFTHHSIIGMVDTLYAYKTIKDIINDKSVFFKDVEGTSSRIAFENVLKLYYEKEGSITLNLDYSNSNQVQSVIKIIEDWISEEKAKGNNIIVDVNEKNPSDIAGTNKNDIVYLGMGDDVLSTGAGNDIVYGYDRSVGLDVNKQHQDTKEVDLGSGNDEYYGGYGKDTIHGGLGQDYISAGSGENYIYCGKDEDADIIRVTGSGIDHIYEATEKDYLRLDSTISSYEQIGKDLHLKLFSGKEVILYDFLEEQEDDNNNQSKIPSGGLPFLVDKDGNVLGYSVPDGKYIDTGYDIPKDEIPNTPKDPEGETPEVPEKPEGSDGGPGQIDPNNPHPKGKEGLPQDWNPETPKPYNPTISGGININRDGIQEALNNDRGGGGDPIVLDLDGDGIRLVKEKGKYFYDLGNDGVAEEIDWISPNDGFLVHDENNNNKVDSVEELFGNLSIDGYDELIKFDTNGDGKVNADDERFNELKVWIDKNQNGISDAGELKTLNELGIKELELTGKGTITGQYDNTLQNIGNVVFEDGTKNEMSDVYFSTNSEQNIYTGTDVEIEAEVLKMPNLKGFGYMPDLHIAVMKNPALKGVLQEISNLSKDDISSLPELARKLIFTWAGIERADSSLAMTDKELLTVLFRFAGLDINRDFIRNPNTRDVLHEIYADFENAIIRALLVQGVFSSFENYVGEYVKDYNLIFGNITGSFEALFEEISSLNVKNNPKLAYNIHEILKEFVESGEVEKSVFDEKMLEFFAQNSLSNIGQDMLDGKVVVTDQIGMALEGISYIILDKDNSFSTIHTSTGNDYIFGGDGTEHINSGDGNDIIIGGKGDDFLSGGNGNDIYIYNLGDGADVINNHSNIYVEKNSQDILKFGEGISPKDIKVMRSGDDLILDFANGQDRVAIQDYFYKAGDSSKYVEIKFFDGTIWGYEYIRDIWTDGGNISDYGKYITGKDGGDHLSGGNGNDRIIGGNGNDNIYAASGNDIIIGGKGDDNIDSYTGDDTYIWNLGDGFDTINDSDGNDNIRFGKGISFRDLKFILDNHNLIIQVKNDPSQGIKIDGFTGNNRYQIEKIYFANGEIFQLNESNLEMHLDKNSYYNPYGSGTNFDDIMHGTNRNDTIYGNRGNDTLIGGYGDDVLHGGYGADTYIYNLGDGFDTIDDYESWYEPDGAEKNIDKIVFGQGISFEDLTFRYEYNSLIINIKGEERQGIHINNYFDTRGGNASQIEELHFADGRVFDLQKEGLVFTQTNESERISGTDFDDVVYGNGGDDTIYTGKGDDILIGGTGNDYLDGGAGADTYIYNLGDGFDTISDFDFDCDNDRDYKNRIINTIRFGEGITKENINISRGENNNLLITINGDLTQGISIDNFFWTKQYEIEQIEFSDGSTIDLTKNLVLNQTDIDDRIYGGENITIYGNGGNDYIGVSKGNNILVGGKGNDELNGGQGNDTYIYNLGDGFDIINDSYGAGDKIFFGEGIKFEDLSFSYDGSDITININGDKTQGMIIKNGLNEYNRIELIEFSDGRKYDIVGKFILGNVDIKNIDSDNRVIGNEEDNYLSFYDGKNYVDGGAGNDTILTGNGNDIIIGGIGNDNLHGGYGDDIYVYNLGDGYDEIFDSNGRDRLVFGEGISYQDLIFRSENSSLYIMIKGDENQGIKITNFFYGGDYKIEYLEFADGSTHMLTLEGLTLHQKEDTYQTDGSDFADKIYCGAGNDIILSRDGNDYIEAGAGDDDIGTGSGDSIIIGGKGNDNIIDHSGNDTYIYNLGDGFDSIQDHGGRDKIVFGEGISTSDLSFSEGEGNLIMNIKNDDTQGIKVICFDSKYNQIEELHFADGSIIDISNYNTSAQLIQAMSSFGATNPATSDMMINELNIVDNVLATNHINKVA